MRCLPYGDTAVLAEVDDLTAVLDLYAQLRDDPPAGLVALVPASRTLLVQFDPAVTSASAVDAHLEAAAATAAPTAPAAEVTLPVVYDGEDLDEVAALTGLDREAVIAAHTGQWWTVGFVGFAPGFAYLVGEDDRLRVPRRPEPRPAVPAGAVGLADAFSGVYPRRSPGGWQLIGRTEVATWDLGRDPPALLPPGTRVRFEAVG
ncbi:carboxyltransferase domain-containing protein [Nitriliruptoraceae bacterium ZYF776]|nr:carboxyltransferase domain-containing protein [Profundirhabdus halotolerans]